MVRERLAEPGRNPHGLWREAGVEALLSEHLGGKRDYGHHFWRLLVLDSWLRQHAAGAGA